MIERLLEALRPLFATWGYLIVAVGAMLENSVGLGLVVPGETLVLMGGFYAALGVLSPVLVLVLAAVGQTLGDLVGYALGRSGGRKILAGPARLRLFPRRLESAEAYWARHGRKTLVLGRFVPVIRTLFPMLAGAGRMPARKFFFYDLIGATAWAATHTGLGFLLGQGYRAAGRSVGTLAAVALVLLAALVAGPWAWRWRRGRQPER